VGIIFRIVSAAILETVGAPNEYEGAYEEEAQEYPIGGSICPFFKLVHRLKGISFSKMPKYQSPRLVVSI
jgi:hypothetical protein